MLLELDLDVNGFEPLLPVCPDLENGLDDELFVERAPNTEDAFLFPVVFCLNTDVLPNGVRLPPLFPPDRNGFFTELDPLLKAELLFEFL